MPITMEYASPTGPKTRDQRLSVILHPVIPNPYTLRGLIPRDATFFSCLDLKDAFFNIHLAPQSQLIFTFQWENPENRDKGQITWTRLPQGFKNSPTTFRTALGPDRKVFPVDWMGCVLLQ